MSIVKENIKRLQDERAQLWERDGKPLADIAATRALTTDEQTRFETVEGEFRAYGDRIETLKAQLEQERSVEHFADALRGGQASKRDVDAWTNSQTGERAALAPGESIRSHGVYERAIERDAGDVAIANWGTLGGLVRALATGGTGSSVVPKLWSSQLIDMARQTSAVGRAGATIVPMEAGTIEIGRKTGNPTASFRAENPGSALSASDPNFDNVTLQAKTMQALVVGSIEFFQDAPNADQLVMQALAESIADKLDLVALYGGITAGTGDIDLETPPNPRGVLAALTANLDTNVLGATETNGTKPAVESGFWNEVLDALFTVIEGNEEPTAILRSGKLARTYAKAVDSTGQPLRTPDEVAKVDQITVNAIPSYTKGTLTTATDLFVADWRQLLIGQRLDITLQPLPELYATQGQTGVLATWRGDVQLARPSAFAVYRSLAGA